MSSSKQFAQARKWIQQGKSNGYTYIWIPAVAMATYYSFFWPSVLALISSVPQTATTAILQRAATYLPLGLVPGVTVLALLTVKLLSYRKHHEATTQPAVERHETEMIAPVESVVAHMPSVNPFHPKSAERKVAFSSPRELLSYFYGEENER